MHPVLILLLAISIVLIGILVLRLHAFLALLLAALTVAVLTPRPVLENAEIAARKVKFSVDADEQVILKTSPKQGAEVGTRYLVYSPQDRKVTGSLDVARFMTDDDGQTVSGAVAQVSQGLPPDGEQLVIHPLMLAEARQAAKVIAPTRVARGFGGTCASIGILIAMASIIGKCLLDSGAADRIVRSTLNVVGQRRAPVAFLGSGFLLGIPVFFDTVFYLMIPLGKATRMRTGGNYLLYILSIVAGGSMAHSLVPPTPGPLIVADQLGVDLLAMITGGFLVGSVCATAGYLFAAWLNRRMEIPLRESSDVSLEELAALSQRDDSELPPTWLSLLPIILPVLLIAMQTGVRTYLDNLSVLERPQWLVDWQPAINTFGDKNIALIIAAAIALATLAWQKRSSTRQLASAVATALAGGGVIILITAAGGAFGAMVRQCGISEEITKLTADLHPLLILPVAFLVTTLIRTAQGSATVAMITAAGVLQGLASSEQLPFHTVYLALAIGCGSKPVAWMADSGFWVICKMSGMSEAEGLKTVTPLSIVMGLTGLATTMVAAMLLPLKG